MMEEHALIALSSVVVLGIAAQWLGWRARIPSILLLLIFGIVAGPVTGWIRPDELLGPLLFPVVSLAVAVILFEGGLSLSFKEFRSIGGVALQLVTIGTLVTWVIATLAARLLLGFDWPLALLLGAILVVSGPTVVGPLLRQVRPTGQSAALLKWEGIVIDPIGALLAVLVFQALMSGEGASASEVALTLVKSVAIGTAAGLVAAFAMVLLIKRDWVPDFLQNPVALMFVVAVYVVSNVLQSESGLFAVTVMGFAMGNQTQISVRHIIEFKENLRVMLIAAIFILLAAHLKAENLEHLGIGSIAFLLTLILLARPAAVFASTVLSRLSLNEKLFISWVAPRGIVAAAIASIFALRLEEIGYPRADELVSITFLVIIGTVAIYGLTARLLAQRLGLAKAHPEGVLFLGGHFWVRQIAKVLHDEGFAVMLVDNNRRNVGLARMEGVPAFYANVFAENVLDQVEIGGIGKLLALTTNDDANSLAAMHFAHVFGRSQIFQLAPEEDATAHEVSRHLRGRFAFGEGMTHSRITQMFWDDAVVKKTSLSKEFDFEALKAHYKGEIVPLFLITENGQLQVFAADAKLNPQPGQTVVSLVMPQDAESSPKTPTEVQ
jgi:NhaP-type Na+/H+ or K+/H+ antiporter